MQRFLHKQKLAIPFSQAAGIDCRDYSLLLERVITDFGADVSFGQAVEKLQEHYGINISGSAVQSITKKHAKACYEMIEKEPDFSGKVESRCLIGEMDGAMIPVVLFEATESKDRRKWRKTGWKEARLCVAREKGSITKIFLATLGSTERAGTLLGRCAKRLGWAKQTKIHCIGDGARWIYEEVERVFGTQSNYLIDFFHLSDYLAGASVTCCQDEPRKWLKERQEEMKEGRIEEVLAVIKAHMEPKATKDENAPVRKCARYMENRPGQFKYKEAIAAELPIGSGEIESGNRSVVQKRLKIPGAWWNVDTAEYMLALRCMRINGDWKRYWRFISPSFARAA